MEELKRTGVPCFVYGYGARRRDGNLRFFAFNEKTFFQHLASAKAVLTGGGFSLLSEALYLKKPILSVPIPNHYEQCYNARILQQRGFGKMVIYPTSDDILTFLHDLPRYEKNVRKYSFNGTEFAKAVEREAARAVKRRKS